jgi:hypothetical protein
MIAEAAWRALVCAIILGMLWGCRAHEPVVASPPPATTQEACQQVRDFFKKFNARSVSPEDMSTGCHMRIASDERPSEPLDRQLQASGWTRTPGYARGAVPSDVSYETPGTRCTILKLAHYSSGGSLHGGIGVSGGSHSGAGVGVGVGIGSGMEMNIDYKIDCMPKS